MSLSGLLNVRKTLQEEKEQDGLAAGLSDGKVSGAQALVHRTCVFCRKETAKYICPTCNGPYCSLTCYNSKRHQGCTSQFAQRSLEDNRDLLTQAAPEDEEQAEEQRRNILSALRRVQEQEDGSGDEDEGSLSSTSLHDSTASDDDQGLFLGALVNLSPDEIEAEAKHFSQSLLQLVQRQKSTATSSQPRVDLRYNLLAVILAFVLITTHLDWTLLVDRPDLSANQEVCQLFDQLVPFFTHDPRQKDSTSTVLSGPEDAVLWILSRMTAQQTGPDPGKLMLALLKDAQKILLPSLVAETSTLSQDGIAQIIDAYPSFSSLLATAFDIWIIWGAGKSRKKPHPVQAKLLFYVSHYLFSHQAGMGEHFAPDLQKEIDRLEEEQRRSVLEDDLKARDRFEQQQADAWLSRQTSKLVVEAPSAERPPAVPKESEGGQEKPVEASKPRRSFKQLKEHRAKASLKK